MTSQPFFSAAALPPRSSGRGTPASRWGDEQLRHRRLSLAAGTALTLTALGIAVGLTIEGFGHPLSLVQLLAASAFVVLCQAATLVAVLARPLVLRILGVVAAIVALVLLNPVGVGGLGIGPVATAVVLLLRSSQHPWLRLISAIIALLAAAAIGMWADGLLVSALARTPMVLASLPALIVGVLLLVNYVGRDTFGALLFGSAVTLGAGGLLGFTGSMVGAYSAGEESLTFQIYAIEMLGMKKMDVILPLIAVSALTLMALFRLRKDSESTEGRVPKGVSPVVSLAALGLAALTAVPAVVDVFSDDAGALLGMLVGTVYLLCWAACVGLWFTVHHDVVEARLPVTALTLDHVLVIGLIVLSPMLNGVLSWLGFMIEGASLYEIL